MFWNLLELQPACLLIYVFFLLLRQRNVTIMDFLAPFVDLWSGRVCKQRKESEVAKSTWLNWNSLCKHPDNFLWIWNILKRWCEVQISRRIFTRGNNEPVLWRFFSSNAPASLSLWCSCLLIKISTCKPIYAKRRAWFSVLCSFLCSHEEWRRNQKSGVRRGSQIGRPKQIQKSSCGTFNFLRLDLTPCSSP